MKNLLLSIILLLTPSFVFAKTASLTHVVKTKNGKKIALLIPCKVYETRLINNLYEFKNYVKKELQDKKTSCKAKNSKKNHLSSHEYEATCTNGNLALNVHFFVTSPTYDGLAEIGIANNVALAECKRLENKLLDRWSMQDYEIHIKE